MKVLALIVVKFKFLADLRGPPLRAIEAARRKFLGVFPRRNDRTFLPGGFIKQTRDLANSKAAGNYWIHRVMNRIIDC